MSYDGQSGGGGGNGGGMSASFLSLEQKIEGMQREYQGESDAEAGVARM